MNVLLTYADRMYRYNQIINRRSAERYCNFDAIWNLKPRDLTSNFRRDNAKLLNYAKGAGYWVWKPFIILQALTELQEGDNLFYCDSGSYFVDDATQIFKCIDTSRQDIIVSCSVHPERLYTKRDAFTLMNCDQPEWVEMPQRIASFLAIRNSKWSRSFCAEWLMYCRDERIVADTPNVDGRGNYSGFKESKGDQSVLSLLTKKHELEIFRDPSQWGCGVEEKYPNSPYGQIIQQTWLVPDPRLPYRLMNKTANFVEKLSKYLPK